MQNIEQAIERESQKNIPTPTVVKTLSDIRKVLMEFDPAAPVNKSQPPIDIATIINTHDSRGNPEQYKVTASTKSKSKREHIIEGIQIIKNRREVKERASVDSEPILIDNRVITPKSPFLDEDRISVDSLIEFWTGGTRESEDIVWNIPEGIFKYDIINHKLRKCTDED